MIQVMVYDSNLGMVGSKTISELCIFFRYEHFVVLPSYMPLLIHHMLHQFCINSMIHCSIPISDWKYEASLDPYIDEVSVSDQ